VTKEEVRGLTMDSRERPLELAYPYLHLVASYFKVNRGGRVVDSGPGPPGGGGGERRKLPGSAGGGTGGRGMEGALEAHAKRILERGLRGVGLVISDDHASIRQAVTAELPGRA